VPSGIVAKIKAMADQAGVPMTDLVVEALGRYVGEDVVTVGDRLSALEREVEALRGKLRSLA
jgi:hypothetical protein